MTKQEVLQGALALNGDDKNYTVTVAGDVIVIEAKYRGTRMRESTFRCMAQLKDDNTYLETNYDVDGYRRQYGSVRRKTISYCPSDRSTEVFDSGEIKRVLRDYLEGCGYRRSKGSLKLALCIAIPALIIASILIAVIISIASAPEFVDTNGPENFALTEITREDILKKTNNYRAFMMSSKHSGHHSDIVGTSLRLYDYDRAEGSFGKFHGVMILQATKTSESTLTLNINSSIESGNAEIVVMIDGEYFCSVEVNQSKIVTLNDISDKEVIVKLAGEAAKIKVDVTRSFGNLS